MAVRNYSATAAATTISSGITNVATTVSVAATSGFPSAPFIGRLDADTANEEIVLVTNVAGLVLTITRGYDSTSAVAHLSGASFRHSVSAIDLREPNTHVNASTGVHGAAGAVVGTTDTQTLTNKTLSGGTITGSVTNSGTVTGGTVNPTTLQSGGVAVPTISSTDTLSNKTLASPVVSGTLTGGTVNPTTLQQGGVQAVTTTGTQTLTGKTLTSPVLNAATGTDAVISQSLTTTTALAAKATGTPGSTTAVFAVQDSGGTNKATVIRNALGFWTFNTDLIVANNGMTAFAGIASAVPLATRGAASQTANLQEWRDSSAVVLSYVDKDGRIVNKIPSVTAAVTSGVSGITTTETTVATAPTITGDGTSKVKVSFTFFGLLGTVSGDTFEIHIKDGATQLAGLRVYIPTTAFSVGGTTLQIVDTPSATTHTYTATCVRSSGTGSATVSAASNAPMTILVEQLLG